MSRVAVVVLGDIAEPTADGFVNRNALLIRSLKRHHQVSVVDLSPTPDLVLPDVDHLLVSRRSFEMDSTRAGRIEKLLRLKMGSFAADSLERELRSTLTSISPDLIFALTYRRIELVRPMAKVAPTILFAEERSQPGATAIPAKGTPLLSRSLDAVKRRACRQAAAVTVVSPSEIPWATERFGRLPIVVPHGVDIDWWSAPVDASTEISREDVLTIGNYLLSRNAEGLVAVIMALRQLGWPAGRRIVVVSATGYHPSLRAIEGPELLLAGAVADPRSLYRAAGAALVPAFEAIGIKNGITQGWGTGCPVIATTASAATVSGNDGVDMLIGRDPVEVASLLLALPDEAVRGRLAAAGQRTLHDGFSNEAHDAALDALVVSFARASS